MADRTQEQPLEATEASGSEDQEVGVLGGIEKTSGREVEDHAPVDPVGDLDADCFQDVGVERCHGVHFGVVGIEGRAVIGVVLVDVAPRHDGSDRPSVKIRFSKREAERASSAFGPVDTNDDLSHLTAPAVGDSGSDPDPLILALDRIGYQGLWSLPGVAGA